MKRIRILVVIAFALISFNCAPASKPASRTDIYPEFADVLIRLKSVELVERDDIKIFGKAKLEKRDYIRVLHLKGSPFEMGYQHGTLLKDEIINLIMKVDKIDRFFEWPKKKHTLRYIRSIEQKIPKSIVDEIKGIAAAVNIDYDHVFAWEISISIWKEHKIGCTNVAATNSATSDGKIVHLRTMDGRRHYPWIVAVFYKPDQGNAFCSVVNTGGVGVFSGMNDKGITINDAMTYDEFNPDGIPLVIFRRIIMENAKNMADVENLVQTSSRSYPNNIMVTDGKTNEIRVYEMGIDNFSIRYPENDIICSTNHAISLGKKGYRESYKRYDFALDYMKKRFAKLNVGKFIELCRTKTIGKRENRINQYSVIFTPNDYNFWVAVEKKDKKPACDNKFIKFNLLE